MKQKVWAKTLLSTYNCLDTIANAIDNLVINQGLSSGRNNMSTMENAEKIISLIQRKKLLINLKIIVENVVAKMEVQVARLLVLKYFDKIKPEVCMKVLGLSRRTYFRKVDKATEEFGEILKSFGYDDETLDNMLAKENWIKEYYNAYLKQVQKDDDFEEDIKTVEFNIKKCRAY